MHERAGQFLLARLLLFAMASVTPLGVSADTESEGNAAQSLELKALIEEGIANNPEILSAAQRLEAARAAVPQARTLPDPTINLSYEHMPIRETMYGVTQSFPFPGKLRLKGEIAERDAERVEREYRALRLGVIARIKAAYYDYALAHQSAMIVDETRRLLVQFEQASEAGYSVGKMAQTDVFRAQAEISRSLARRATIDQQRRSSTAELARLLNRSPLEPLPEPGGFEAIPLRGGPADLVAKMETTAPILQSRLKSVERGNAAIELARRQYLPDFDIGMRGVRDEPVNESGYQVMLNVTVPLYFGTKQRYGVREALASREEAAGDLQATRQELAMRIRDNVAQVERADRLIDLLQNAIIPPARLALESAQSGYTVGRVDFLTLLNSLLTLQDNELELRSEIAEHEKARARLEEIIGEEP